MNEFKSLEELYNRLKPALYSKRQELKKYHISYIKEEDIWNYLSETVWKKNNDLTLSQMVSDILSIDIDNIKSYMFNILKQRDVELIKEEGNLL